MTTAARAGAPYGCTIWRRFLLVSALATAAAIASPTSAQQVIASRPLVIGTSYSVEVLDVLRELHVVPPPEYADDDRAYPLVLVLDGGIRQDLLLTLGMERWNQLWGRSAPAILVGIETVDRQRELLPPTSDAAEQARYPTAGESAAFRAWLADTVLPMLRERYRTDGRAFLVGESAAGHFVVETWLIQPELFDGFAALSPSLQWNDQSLSRRAAGMNEGSRPPLFLSLADEGGATEEGILRLAGASSACFADRRETLHHATTLHGLFPEALQYLLPTDADWLADYGLTLDCEASRSAE
ncbi:alpha/beta hydrolase [Aurantiacibacter poecillastricola]|uniref:alpha/beta hydrolase n=1 Tax=Aurantiacibacter poecillastricola TaxID=3064385 RepID=UPI00273FC1AD|nr:alpha/beta hydrolase-fold protein [Aurantiacibacter sp. 219JJ12-13]MDP5262540.1 alpha/beta hydrolase-fold protein [Aurantiacibacter sp. 219JJ12-13]